MTTYATVIEHIERQVHELNTLLGYPVSFAVGDLDAPRVTFGYLGDCTPTRDDRLWYIFLPHPGRTGDVQDRLGGFHTGDSHGASSAYLQLVGAVILARHLKGALAQTIGRN